MNTVSVSRSSASTWRQTLVDLLDASPLESRAFVLEESATNLRELIDCVVAWLNPLALKRGLRLRVSIDQTVAETIFADSGRLGQLAFHLLNRAIRLSTHGEILFIVRAQPLNPGSQRIFISIVGAAQKSRLAELPQLPDPAIDDPEIASRLADADACLPLCRLLAQRMHGKLDIVKGLEEQPCAIFHAPFDIEQRDPSTESARGDTQVPLLQSFAQPQDNFASVTFEPFEHRYLHALSEEGIDLRAFLDSWREAMNDDLERLRAMHREGNLGHLHSVLHRLSGAVALVGAQRLTEALRSASMSPLVHTASSIDTLMSRARSLVTQLEASHYAYGSTSP